MILPLLGGTVLLGSGCEQKGPAEQAGENIDEAADNAADALDPNGPAEEAGQAVDDAVNDIQ